MITKTSNVKKRDGFNNQSAKENLISQTTNESTISYIFQRTLYEGCGRVSTVQYEIILRTVLCVRSIRNYFLKNCWCRLFLLVLC